MASSLYTTGSALGFVCHCYANVPIDTICTFIAFSWISHVLGLRESRTIMVDKGTDMVMRRSARSGEHPDKCHEGSITGSKSLYPDSRGDCSPQIIFMEGGRVKRAANSSSGVSEDHRDYHEFYARTRASFFAERATSRARYQR